MENFCVCVCLYSIEYWLGKFTFQQQNLLAKWLFADLAIFNVLHYKMFAKKTKEIL